MGFLDKAKAAAEQAATKVQEGVEDVQAKRETGQTYAELGRETFRLIEAGEISHPALDPIADRVRATEAKAAAAGGGDPTPPASEPSEPPPPAAPPAMPS